MRHIPVMILVMLGYISVSALGIYSFFGLEASLAVALALAVMGYQGIYTDILLASGTDTALYNTRLFKTVYMREYEQRQYLKQKGIEPDSIESFVSIARSHKRMKSKVLGINFNDHDEAA